MKKLLSIAATLVTAIAMFAVGTASWLYLYQPKTPKCLK